MTMVMIVSKQHKEKKNMGVAMIQTMYDKGAPKSVPNVHRIPMNSIPKVDKLRGTMYSHDRLPYPHAAHVAARVLR